MVTLLFKLLMMRNFRLPHVYYYRSSEFSLNWDPFFSMFQGQKYHLRTTQSNHHEICKNCTCILFFIEILIISVHDCWTIAAQWRIWQAITCKCTCMFPLYRFNTTFILCFNSLNSASAKGASTLNDVAAFIIVYSYAQLQLFKLFDEWHFMLWNCFINW